MPTAGQNAQTMTTIRGGLRTPLSFAGPLPPERQTAWAPDRIVNGIELQWSGRPSAQSMTVQTLPSAPEVFSGGELRQTAVLS